MEVRADAYPGERLMACRNPLLADERARRREELLDATEELLEPIVTATRRGKRRLRGGDRIGEQVGKVIGKFRMANHFEWDIDDNGASVHRRNAASIRTSLPETELDDRGAVRAYKRLGAVERAFRSLGSADLLNARPVFHRTAERVRAHVLLRMLAHYVEWHMRRRLAPLLFDDEDPAGTEARRMSVVAPARASDSARRKARTKRTDEGRPVHSFRSLLCDLATVTKNRVAIRQTPYNPRCRSRSFA